MKHEFLEPLKMTQQQLANSIGVSRIRINEVILGKRSLTPDTAFRLAKFFNTTPTFWMNLQINIEMWHTLQKKSDEYADIKPYDRKVA